jgi:D-alanine-D-alanine ligase
MKRNIAILAGGFDAERVVSLKSAQVVKQNLDSEKYNLFVIEFDSEKWISETGSEIDKNNFTILVDNKNVKFDACFMAIHGSPVEDGKIQGYFEILGIPYTGCDGRTMAITMDKILTKEILQNTYGVKTAKFEVYRRGEEILESKFEHLGFPMFIKPNSVGSSFGVTKVKEKSQIKKAIEDALIHDDVVIIEEFIEGREFAHGVLQEGDKLHILPITEIISENEFFDYQAKYEGKSKEVTPAENLLESITKQMYETTEKVFRIMNCKGLARVDYLLKGDELYFLEVNTIPGLSEASIYPQQLNAYGLSLKEGFGIILENCF